MGAILYKNIKFSIIGISFFFLCIETYAQEKWTITQDELYSMGIKYEKPELMDEIEGSDCFNTNPILQKMMKCGGNILKSKDGRFISYNMIGYVYYKGNTEMFLLPPSTQNKNPDPYNYPELAHLRYARNDLNLVLNHDESKDWKAKINYYGQELTKRKFNADTAINYTGRLKPDYYYKEKYRNLWVLILRKENGLILRSYCLYEDDLSKKELDRFKAEVESAFQFEPISKTQQWPHDPNGLKSMKLAYKKPDLLRAAGLEYFKNQPTLKYMLGSRDLLRSEDGNFIAMFPDVYEIFSKEKLLRIKDLFPSTPELVNKQHIAQLKKELKAATFEEKGGLNWKDYLNYYPTEEAMSKFNADTAITYTIKLNPDYRYNGTHPNLWALTIQKRNKGYVTIHCFYEDMPEDELEQYKAAVESIFTYED